MIKKIKFIIIVGVIGISVFFSVAYFSSVSTPEETMVVGYCQDWCNADELTNLGCNAEVIDFIYRSTNIFDENFDNSFFYLNLIGLPDSISEEKFDECLDIIREKRVESLENTDLNSKGCPQFCSEKVADNVFSFCGGDGFYSEHYLFTRNSTHFFDHNECEWRPLAEDVDPEFTEQQFQAIIEYCDTTKELVETRGLSYSNGTHTIDTMTCQWRLSDVEFISGLGLLQKNIEHEICSIEMMEQLEKYSSMFDKGAPYGIEDISLPDGVDVDHFDQCVEVLLENRDDDSFWND